MVIKTKTGRSEQGYFSVSRDCLEKRKQASESGYTKQSNRLVLLTEEKQVNLRKISYRRWIKENRGL